MGKPGKESRTEVEGKQEADCTWDQQAINNLDERRTFQNIIISTDKL
jgi:hypothetical protein